METPPAIPARVRHHDTKRHTMAPDYARARTVKAGGSRATMQPASTEVISSLISSLSAISTPAENLFDNLLPEASQSRTAPSSPMKAVFDASDPVVTSNEPMPTQQPNGFLHPSDAALPPVIRTSKPPSGYSSLTAPKRRSFGRTPTISRSSPNLKQDAATNRNGSVGAGEAGVGISADRGSTHSDASRGSRSQASVHSKSSKDKMRELDRERRRREKSQQLENAGGGLDRPPPRRSFSDDIIPQAARRNLEVEDAQGGSAGPSGPRSPGGPGGIGSGRGIPTRDSSLKHHDSASKRRSRKSYHAGQIPTEVHIEQPNEDAAVEAPNELSTHEKGEDKAKRRIQELKELKQQRSEQQMDDGTTVAKEREARRKANKGRSSLPAPSTPLDTTMDSMPTKATTAKRRRGSDPSLKRPIGLASPPPEREEKHHRTSSNAPSAGRSSFGVARDERVSLEDSIDEAIAEYLLAPRLSRKIYHPQSGRAITFSDVGDPEGSVVFCCLGMGTTRYLTAFYDELATTLNLRLITLDRPGIGESEPYRNGPESPLAWPDDIRAVCAHLGISRFSILAHSAGAIYALATAIRMPRHIRGRMHLLAPWIPPSQMFNASLNHEPAPVTSLPMSQRLLRSLPTTFLKAANTSWFSMTSTSLTTSIQRSPKRTGTNKRQSLSGENSPGGPRPSTNAPRPSYAAHRLGGTPGLSINTELAEKDADVGPSMLTPASDTEGALSATLAAPDVSSADAGRQAEYDARLTQAIWAAATTGANPAVDLLVCLERVHDIGFRYTDVTKPVMIYHGEHDSRVPVENVRWLGGMMRSAEVKVLNEEGHGLMANPIVMGDVLNSIAQEWADWLAVTRNGKTSARQ